MDRASSLIYPGSKTLAGWWRQVASLRPLALGVGYVFVHRIEAAVNVVHAEPIDPLAHLLLQALSLEGRDPAAARRVQERLHLPTPLMQHVLADLEREGLLQSRAADGWRLTDPGAQALKSKVLPRRIVERHVFPFIEQLDSAGQRRGPPLQVPLADCVGAPWPVQEPYRFDVAYLSSILAAAPENQTLANAEEIETWQRVVVDRAERVLLAIVRTAAEWLAFAVKVESWTLCEQAPALRLPADRAIWRELAEPPAMEALQEAWRGWCRQRQLPMNEVEACALKCIPPRLEVLLPPRLLQRLQAARSDLFKGDAWILLGDGYVRPALQLALGKNP